MSQNRIDQIAAELDCSRADARKLFEAETPDGPTVALTRRGVVAIANIGPEEEVRTNEGWMTMANCVAGELRRDGVELRAVITPEQLRARLDNERRYRALASEGLPTRHHVRHACGHAVYWDDPEVAVITQDEPCPWCKGAPEGRVLCDPWLGELAGRTQTRPARQSRAEPRS